MAYACDICNKGKQFGNNRPFSLKATRKVWKPNLQRQRISIGSTRIQVKLCTACIRTLAKYQREAAAKVAAAEVKATEAKTSVQAAA
ncbi:MAG TPA: 50S ribosomal protein L28 [Candidatus Saccharimonadia bacterium]|nr:50S ribosomal protein L28 [Candidatus Saccharimonadia bacterium]